MQDKIIFISGGTWQKAFVEYLKKKKYFLAIVNPVENETTKICDQHIKCDINDIEEIEKHIKDINPKFITSDQSDVSTKIVSILSEKYNLPCNPTSVIDKFTNKFEIYKFAAKIGIPTPCTELASCVDDLKIFGLKNGYPLVIKPTDSTMSRGFRKIDSESQISEKILQESLSFSKSKQVISQKFIEGDMITCEGVCSGNAHKTLATSIKKQGNYFKSGITSEVSYPADCDDELVQKIIKANDEYVEKSGMKFGLTHSEYIVNDKDFNLIEIGARGGGAGISNIITPWVSGVDNYDILYRSLIGETCDLKIQTLKRSALLKYYRKEDISEEQANKIKKIKGVAIFYYNFLGTQFIFDKEDCRYSMGIYLAENNNDMKDLMRIVENVNVIS